VFGSVAKFRDGQDSPNCGRDDLANSANCWNAGKPMPLNCPLRIKCAVSIPAIVAALMCKDLERYLLLEFASKLRPDDEIDAYLFPPVDPV
jgi:hypothetical protein